MATRKFSFRYGDPARVVVKTSFGNRSARVFLDDVEIGSIDGKDRLKSGQDFPLSDGSHLLVSMTTGFSGGIQVAHGRHGAMQTLPGSASTPSFKVEQGGGAAYFVAVMSTLVGALALAQPFGGVLVDLGFGWFTIISGAIFGALGYFMKTSHSFAASTVAAVLWAIDMLLTMYATAELGGNPMSGILPRAAILWLLARAVPAAKELRALKKETAGPPAATPVGIG